MVNLFSKDEEAEIRIHIANAESRSTGQIKVFVEPNCKVEPKERVLEIFAKHRLYQTRQRNGVLIYIADQSHQLYIWGDEGIHEKAGQILWDESIEQMRSEFSSGSYLSGLLKGIDLVGNKLSNFFPRGNQPNENELPDDIIYGNEH